MKRRAVVLLLVLPLLTGCAIWFGPPIPVAVVTANPRTGDAPLAVTFDGSGSYERFHGELEEYQWDFGDGTDGEGVTVTHTYTHPGDYTATLRVINRLGLKGEACISVSATGEGGDPTTLGPLTGSWEGIFYAPHPMDPGCDTLRVEATMNLVQTNDGAVSGSTLLTDDRCITEPFNPYDYQVCAVYGHIDDDGSIQLEVSFHNWWNSPRYIMTGALSDSDTLELSFTYPKPSGEVEFTATLQRNT